MAMLLKLFFLLLNLSAAAFAFNNIIDTLASANASTLLQLISQAGLTDTLKTGGKVFYVFVLEDVSDAEVGIGFRLDSVSPPSYVW